MLDRPALSCRDLHSRLARDRPPAIPCDFRDFRAGREIARPPAPCGAHSIEAKLTPRTELMACVEFVGFTFGAGVFAGAGRQKFSRGFLPLWELNFMNLPRSCRLPCNGSRGVGPEGT